MTKQSNSSSAILVVFGWVCGVAVLAAYIAYCFEYWPPGPTIEIIKQHDDGGYSYSNTRHVVHDGPLAGCTVSVAWLSERGFSVNINNLSYSTSIRYDLTKSQSERWPAEVKPEVQLQLMNILASEIAACEKLRTLEETMPDKIYNPKDKDSE